MSSRGPAGLRVWWKTGVGRALMRFGQSVQSMAPFGRDMRVSLPLAHKTRGLTECPVALMRCSLRCTRHSILRHGDGSNRALLCYRKVPFHFPQTCKLLVQGLAEAFSLDTVAPTPYPLLFRVWVQSLT